jgi:hypothetical protein
MMSFRNASNINASHSVFVDGGDVYQTIHNNTTIEAVIHLTGSVTSLSHDYVGSVHGARKEMMQLFAELGSLDAVLKMLQKVLERSDTAGDSTLGGLAAPLDECKALLGTLKVELTPGSGVRGATASLTWPLKMEETKKCLSRIERAKSVFILAMTSDQMYAKQFVATSVTPDSKFVSQNTFTRTSSIYPRNPRGCRRGSACRSREQRESSPYSTRREIDPRQIS